MVMILGKGFVMGVSEGMKVCMEVCGFYVCFVKSGALMPSPQMWQYEVSVLKIVVS